MKEELQTNPFAKDPRNMAWKYAEEVDKQNRRVVSGIFSADWARETEALLIRKAGQYLNPFGLFVDGTNLDDLGRNQGMPLMMTPLNFKNHILSKKGSKRVFGWMPLVKCSDAERKDDPDIRIGHLTLFHEALRVILRPIKVRDTFSQEMRIAELGHKIIFPPLLSLVLWEAGLLLSSSSPSLYPGFSS